MVRINGEDDDLSFIDMFCGMGGFSYGFKSAGFKHKFGVDCWPLACQTYRKNVGDCECVDVRRFSPAKGSALILIGSPPCQTFSKANTKNRSCDLSLTKEFFRIVNELKPEIWIMENVPEVIEFIDAPFKQVFEMEDFGLLQRRKRMFASNVPLKPVAERMKYLSEIQVRKQMDFRKEAVFRKYPTITGRYNSFVKTSTKFKDRFGVREPSHLEALQIQSFPFNYWLPKTTQRDMEQMIGNAVPPLMAFKIAEYIRKILKNPELKGTLDFFLENPK